MRFHTLQALLAWEAPLPSLKQVGHVHETATCWPLTLSNVLMLRPCSAGFPRSSWNRPLMGRETWVPKRKPLVESGDENQCPPLPRECRSGAPPWFSTGRNQCQTRSRPCHNGQDHDELDPNGSATNASLAATIILLLASESTPAMVVVDTPTPVEEAGCYDAPGSTKAVDRASIHWIINLQRLKEHRCCLIHKAWGCL